jgi:hypothetical protein
MPVTKAVEKERMAEIKYVAKISSQGANYVVWIPKDFKEQAKKMKGKQVLITITDDWQERV